MDRKALLTILITAGLMMGWHFGYYAPRAEKQRQAYEALKKQKAARTRAGRS
jgi:membrane protein YqaA with SNARE-associated domain